MSTTYNRLQVLLHEIQRNESDTNRKDPTVLAQAIVDQKIPELTINRKDNETGNTNPHSISIGSVKKYFNLLVMLGLVQLQFDSISLTNRGQRALESSRYSNVMIVVTYELLSSFSLPDT